MGGAPILHRASPKEAVISYYPNYTGTFRKQKKRKLKSIKFYLALILMCALVGAAIPFVLEEGEKLMRRYEALRLVESHTGSPEKLKEAIKEKIGDEEFERLKRDFKEKVGDEKFERLKKAYKEKMGDEKFGRLKRDYKEKIGDKDLEKLKRAYKEKIGDRDLEKLKEVYKKELNNEDIRKLKEKFKGY